MPFTPGIQIQTQPLRDNLSANRQNSEAIGSSLQAILGVINDQKKRRAEQEVLGALSQARNSDEARSILQDVMTKRQSQGQGILSRLNPFGQYSDMTDTEATARSSLLGNIMVPESKQQYDNARLDEIRSRIASNKSLADQRNSKTANYANKRQEEFAWKTLQEDIKNTEAQIAKLKEGNPNLEKYKPKPASWYNAGKYAGSDTGVEKTLEKQRQLKALTEKLNTLKAEASGKTQPVAASDQQAEVKTTFKVGSNGYYNPTTVDELNAMEAAGLPLDKIYVSDSLAEELE